MLKTIAGVLKPTKGHVIVRDVVLVNKIDALPVFDFSLDNIREYVGKLNPNAVVFPISAKTGEGVDAFCDWVRARVKEQQA